MSVCKARVDWNSLGPLGAQNKDIGADLDRLLTRVRLRQATATMVGYK